MSPDTRQSRKLGIGLVLGIVFLPFVFAWFTLRKGHSPAQRYVALGWMVLVLFAMAKHHAKQERAAVRERRAATPATQVVPEPAAQPKPPLGPRNATREVPRMVSAAGIWKHYHANEVSADEAYKGKLLLVFGVVDVIQKDAVNNMVLALRTGDRSLPIPARVNDSEKVAVAALQKGHHVRLICRGAGMLLDIPGLSNCTFAPLAVPDDPEPPIADLANQVPSDEAKLAALPAYRDVWNDGHESGRRLLLSAISQLILLGGFSRQMYASCESNQEIQKAAIILWSIAGKQRDWQEDFAKNLRGYLASIRSAKHLGVRSEVVDRKGGWDFSAIAYLANKGSPEYFREFMQNRELPGRCGWPGKKPSDGASTPYFVESELAREYMLTLLKVAQSHGDVISAQDCSSVGLRLFTQKREIGPPYLCL